MSLTLAFDDISIDVDTLFHTIDCGIAAFRIYEQKVILRIISWLSNLTVNVKKLLILT